MNKLYLLFILLLITLQSVAQKKYEKEIRINKDEAPVSAQKFIDSLYFKHKIKWFKEFGINTSSFEAKSKNKGKKYSIEFSPDGQLQDVEIEIEEAEIPSKIHSAIQHYLAINYPKYKFQKIQIQFSGEEEKVLSYLRYNSNPEMITLRYEVVISARVDKSFHLFELLFSDDGVLIHKAEIIQKNNDHIIY